MIEAPCSRQATTATSPIVPIPSNEDIAWPDFDRAEALELLFISDIPIPKKTITILLVQEHFNPYGRGHPKGTSSKLFQLTPERSGLNCPWFSGTRDRPT